MGASSDQKPEQPWPNPDNCTVSYMYYSLLRVGNDKEEGAHIHTRTREREIINMVLANNAIRLRELQANIIGEHAIFNNVHQVSQSVSTHPEKTSGSNETLSSVF